MPDSPGHKDALRPGLGATLPQRELCLTNYFSIPYFHPEALGLGLPVSSGGGWGGEGGASPPVTPSLPVLPLVSPVPECSPLSSIYRSSLLLPFSLLTVYSP